MVTRSDDAEHRRGLILGLSLAEILLLLLFLMLLALAWEITRTSESLTAAEARASNLQSALDELRPMLASIQSAGAAASVDEIIDKLASVAKLEAALAALQATNAALSSQLTEMAERSNVIEEEELRSLLETARRVNPDDPPAVLQALEAIANAGSLGDLTRLREAVAADLSAFISVAEVGEQVATVLQETELSGAEGKAIAELALTAHRTGEHNWPPIINLSEAGGYYFATGRADLTPEFADALRSEIVPLLKKNVDDFNVDVIEVIGHTDSQPLAPRPSNLDQLLPAVFSDRPPPIGSLLPGDNAGLGMARAVAVANVLREDPSLAQLRILPLSGAQLIDTGDRLASAAAGGDVKERRRIEVRMRRSEQRSGQ